MMASGDSGRSSGSDHQQPVPSSGSGKAATTFKLRRINKQFSGQESLLLIKYRSSIDVQTMFAFAMAFVHAFLLIQLLSYYFDRQTWHNDMSFLHWSFVESFSSFALRWTQLLLLTIAMHPLTRCWLSGFLPTPLFMLTLAAYIGTTTTITVTSHMSNTLLAAISCEHTRLMMKVIAFVITSGKESTVAQDKDAGEGKQQTPTQSSLSHYVYFLFAPTLVFRHSYPRTERTDWGRVARLAYYFVVVVFAAMIAIRHTILPVFKDAGLRPIHIRDLVRFQMSAFAFAFLFHVMGLGFALIHCFMNIFAEVLRFADRNFYQDWWSTTNAMDRLRRWNSCIGDWIYEYLYSAIVSATRGNKPLSSVLVFLASALLHDYAINMMLGTRFLLLMTITYGGLGSGVLLFILTYQRMRWQRFLGGFVVSNAVDHFATGAAWIIWINMYSIEYYCRVNVPVNETSIADAFRLRAPTCLQLQWQ